MPANKKPIILLSGPIGAGKTTVAKELVAHAPGAVSYIEGDKFWCFIARDARIGQHNNFKMIMTSMITAAVPMALYGYEVILDFSIPPWFLDTAKRLAKAREVPMHYVVLRPAEAICATRAATRADGVIEDYTIHAHDLYTAFDEAEPAHIINDDENEPYIVAARIRKGLNEGIFRLS